MKEEAYPMKTKIFKRLISAALSVLLITGAAAGLGSVPVSAAGSVNASAAEQLENTSAASTDAITLGQYVSVKMSASGGTGGYTYSVSYLNRSKDTEWKVLRNYSSYAAVNYKPTEAGTHYLYVRAKDSSGKIVGKRFMIKVSPDIVNKSTLSKSEICLGSAVTVNARATGGAGGNTYAVLYKRSGDSSYTVKQYYSTNTAVELKPAKTVDYEFVVKAKDKNGKIAEKKLTLKVYDRLKNNSTVSASEIVLGKTVTVKGIAEGGKPGYTYSLMYKEKNDTAWGVAREKGTAATMTFTPEKAGTFTLCAIVRDGTSTAAKKYFNLTVTTPKDAVDKALAEALKPGMSDLEKIRAIHNWLVNNVTYDVEGLESGNIPDTSFTAEGLFETRVAVCDGYAKAFVQMATRAGFNAIRVTGMGYTSSGSEAHAWNQIKYNGKWYNVDVTWDDPVTNAGYGDNLKYTYFLIPDSIMDLDHTADSEKYSCTAAQPVSEFIDKVIAEEKEAVPGVIFCNSESEFGAGVNNINVSVQSTATFVIKTDKTSAELRSILSDNLPQGSYSVSYSSKTWKLSGYVCYVVSVTPA